jgi:hypothetical protein
MFADEVIAAEPLKMHPLGMVYEFVGAAGVILPMSTAYTAPGANDGVVIVFAISPFVPFDGDTGRIATITHVLYVETGG